jgi:hypothetical protein
LWSLSFLFVVVGGDIGEGSDGDNRVRCVVVILMLVVVTQVVMRSELNDVDNGADYDDGGDGNSGNVGCVGGGDAESDGDPTLIGGS